MNNKDSDLKAKAQGIVSFLHLIQHLKVLENYNKYNFELFLVEKEDRMVEHGNKSK